MGRKKRRVETTPNVADPYSLPPDSNPNAVKIESATLDESQTTAIRNQSHDNSALHWTTSSAATAPVPRDPRSRIAKPDHGSSNVNPVPLCLPVNPLASQTESIPSHRSYSQQERDSELASKLWLEEERPLDNKTESKTPLRASGYATTSHSADLISEDIYVSDGSDEEDEMDEKNGSALELNLTASKMGLMRRGMSSVLFQPKTWVRSATETLDGTARLDDDMAQVSEDDENGHDREDDDEKKSKGPSKIDISNMDPAQRAAYLLAEKQKKLEEAKQLKRRLESAENAGRDPCLFSKRTAFDIRMDQIEEKPWDRSSGGTGDITDYFNYGMGEEDWLEYSERQKMVRQELTDAARQKRMPDPTLVPVAPKAPSRQAPRVAVVTKKKMEEEENAVAIGPTFPKSEVKNEDDESGDTDKPQGSDAKHGILESNADDTAIKDAEELIGGAWGIPKGSKLAKLLEEQEKSKNVLPPPPPPPPPPPMLHPMPSAQSPPRQPWNAPGRDSDEPRRDGQKHGGYMHTPYHPEYPPPPPHGNWRGGRGFHPGRSGPPMPPPPGHGFEGRGFPPPPVQQFGGRGFRGGFRGGRGGSHGGRGNRRRH